MWAMFLIIILSPFVFGTIVGFMFFKRRALRRGKSYIYFFLVMKSIFVGILFYTITWGLIGPII